MKIVALKETFPGEKRVPLVPASVDKLVKSGADITVEAGIGETCRYTDADYEKAGAKIGADRKELISSADMILRLRKPPIEEIPLMKKGAIHISYLDPFNEKELLDAFMESGVNAISLEMIPRSTIAQKMDVLSSQANLGGYVAVILAAEKLDQILPMMTTPAGTIKPSRVFIICRQLPRQNVLGQGLRPLTPGLLSKNRCSHWVPNSLKSISAKPGRPRMVMPKP